MLAGTSACPSSRTASSRSAATGCSTPARPSTSSTAAPTTRASTAPPAGLLAAPLRAGTLGVVNAFGTGIADDKLVHAYVEDLIRFYCSEEPLLGSVHTYDLSTPAALEEALDRLHEIVVKPRSGSGGEGVVLGPAADQATLDALRAELTAAPERYVAQELVHLSTHPTVIDGELVPRHVDLRAFVFLGDGDEAHVLPGGLDARGHGGVLDGRELLAGRRREGHLGAAVSDLPAWARWSPVAASMPWTIGVEEEVMLLDPDDAGARAAHRRRAQLADAGAGRARARPRRTARPPS